MINVGWMWAYQSRVAAPSIGYFEYGAPLTESTLRFPLVSPINHCHEARAERFTL